eukprot:scaffold13395_cov71-Cyclotella_meneghiniana.AAC.8
MGVSWWMVLVEGATADEAVLATVLEMAHIICLMRKILRNNKERCGFIASKCMLDVGSAMCVMRGCDSVIVGGR